MIDINSIVRSNDPRRIDLEGRVMVAHQPEFMPWLGFISKARMGDCYLIWDTDQFKKETFQNRNRIRIKGGNGASTILVPVKAAKTKLLAMHKVEIFNDNRWQNKLLRTIEQSYGKTPYFEYLYPDLKRIFLSEYKYLVDLNMAIIRWAFLHFGIGVPVFTVSGLSESGIDVVGENNDAIISMCRAVDAAVFVFGKSGRNYIDYEKFKQAGILPVFQDFQHPVYTQIQGGFLPNMSFIDILFNHGKDAPTVLGKSSYLLK